MGWASILVSAVALLLATASLWVTSLAGADIDVYHVPKLDRLWPAVYTGGLVKVSRLRITLFVANGGARAGLLESLEFSNLSLGPATPWTRREYHGFQMVGNERATFGPFALKAGEAETLVIEVDLDAATLSAEDEAKRISRLGQLSATVDWSFFRASSPLQRIASVLSRRESVRITRSIDVTIDTSGYRSAAIGNWRRNKDSAYLADIAEGADPTNLT